MLHCQVSSSAKDKGAVVVLGDDHFMQGMSRLPSYFTLAPFEEVARTARMVGARSKGTFPDHMFTDLSLGNTSIHTG